MQFIKIHNYLRFACLSFFFLLPTLSLKAQPPAYAIAGVPDTVYDYVLRRTETSYQDPNYPYGFDSKTMHWVDDGSNAYIYGNVNGMYDNGAQLTWYYVGTTSAGPNVGYCEILQDGISHACVHFGDTIDGRLSPWTQSLLEVMNPGGLTNPCDSNANIIAVRYIAFLNSFPTDTFYGYWTDSVHLVMETPIYNPVSTESADAPQAEFKVGPNPVGDEGMSLHWASMSLQQKSVYVLDLQGRQLIQKELGDEPSSTYLLETAALSKGMYILYFRDGHELFTHKFVRH